MTDPIVSFLEERLDAYLDDLRTLVGIDSGTRDKAGVERVNEWLEHRLITLGFSVERHAHTETGDNLLATLDGSGSGHILLLGHSDTVFPRGTAAERPLTIAGDKILGPGTCDMKAGLLAGCYAVAALSELGFQGFSRITYLCVSDEEIEERYSPDLIRATARQADAVLTLEAARENGDIVIARKGVRVYAIEAFGHAAHAGVEPEKGSNAILVMAHHSIAIDLLNGYRPDVTVNLGVIEGGSEPNVVPDYARLLVDLRAFTTDNLQAVTDAVAEKIEQEIVPGVHMRMTPIGHGHKPMPYTPEVAMLMALAQQAAGELGFSVRGARTGGASDASLAAAEGKPVLDG
ncbi:MAG: M20 family metallopeptidase, partial [Anaerolineales bacterium]|nr:M20 family metallopeptidase [Anaerolineales bacterium]